MPTSLQGIAKKAASQKGYRFRHLSGMLDEDFLKQCWRDIRKDAASGVDHVSAQASEQHLDENIHRLVERLKQKRDRATLVRRHSMPTGALHNKSVLWLICCRFHALNISSLLSILSYCAKPPTGEGTQRPLGIPAVEDKLLQLAVARLLEAIYEPDCRRCSDGYRPPVGALDAVDTRTIKLQFGRYAWVVEADITQFFDTIDHDWMGRMLAERIDDGALLRLIRKWLKAGVLDTDGQVLHPVTGTPQGGTVSPVLANVFLHYVLDVWFEKVVKRHCRGEACLIRYADDCVCAFEDQAEAERFDNGLGQRREKFGLELSGAKTRIIPFSRHRLAGKTSCEFLGCEFRWGKDRKGQAHLKRRTARKKLRTSLKRFTAWCKENRHLRVPVLFQRLNAKLRGYYNYYGVHGNAASLQECFNKAMRIVLTWLNRRSQRHRYTWPGYTEVLERFQVARPRIVGRPKTRQAPLTTSADLRTRVLLKSPVRENRTPGSVRGPSGNRRSYRDEAIGSTDEAIYRAIF
jgi:RNA-directed DNA polymerase